MNGYIIEKYNQMNNAYTSRRLIEEGKKAGIDFRIVGVYDTVYSEGKLINSGIPLEQADHIINRYKYGNLKDSLAALGNTSVNSIEIINKYVDKYRQIGIKSVCMSQPKTLLAITESPFKNNSKNNFKNKFKEQFERIASYTGLPFVAKGLCGSQGNMVHLVNCIEDYKAICLKYPEKELLFQEFIETSFGRDVRMLAVKGEVIGCMQRKSNGDFRANFALGAKVTAYNINSDIRTIAKDVYMQTQADVLGIDLLFGKDSYIFCEINITPGIEGIETACGCNAAAAIVNI